MAKRSKVMEYRRVRWLQPGPVLGDLLRQAWDQFPTQREREVTRSDGSLVVGLNRSDAAAGTSIFCGHYVDQQSVGTISMLPAAVVDPGEQHPGEDQNFLSNPFFAHVEGNEVICIDCGRSAARLQIFLAGLFRQAGMPERDQQFDLVRVAEPNRLAMIERKGVSAIGLNVALSQAEAAVIEEAGHEGGGIIRRFNQAVREAFDTLTAQDADLEGLRETNKPALSVRLSVGKGEVLAARESLDHFAHEVVEDGEAEDYLIHLRDGNTIRASEVTARKRVSLTSNANGVERTAAWDAMRDYLRELGANGQREVQHADRGAGD